MPDDIEKINEIFRIHDENAKKKTGQTGKTGAQPAAKPQEQPPGTRRKGCEGQIQPLLRGGQFLHR